MLRSSSARAPSSSHAATSLSASRGSTIGEGVALEEAVNWVCVIEPITATKCPISECPWRSSAWSRRATRSLSSVRVLLASDIRLRERIDDEEGHPLASWREGVPDASAFGDVSLFSNGPFATARRFVDKLHVEFLVSLIPTRNARNGIVFADFGLSDDARDRAAAEHPRAPCPMIDPCMNRHQGNGFGARSAHDDIDRRGFVRGFVCVVSGRGTYNAGTFCTSVRFRIESGGCRAKADRSRCGPQR